MIHSTIVIANHLNVFDIIEDETSVSELAAQTGAEELLLRESDTAIPVTRTHEDHNYSPYHACSCVGGHFHTTQSELLHGHEVFAKAERGTCT